MKQEFYDKVVEPVILTISLVIVAKVSTSLLTKIVT